MTLPFYTKFTLGLALFVVIFQSCKKEEEIIPIPGATYVGQTYVSHQIDGASYDTTLTDTVIIIPRVDASKFEVKKFIVGMSYATPNQHKFYRTREETTTVFEDYDGQKDFYRLADRAYYWDVHFRDGDSLIYSQNQNQEQREYVFYRFKGKKI
ncbi:hypothetical protein KFE98_11825 [bacterium SCSIO 12741]|nr:hypothetical protein KFE98_11825 [bacterium SCSIO 12741]